MTVKKQGAQAFTKFEHEFFASLHRQYRDAFSRIADRGYTPDDLGDPVELAERVVASTPLEPSPVEDLTGPFYATPSLVRWLGISRQALHERVRSHTVLGMQTGDRQWVYPAWQFTTDRRVVPHLPEVLRALANGTDERWTWAIWLTAPNEDYGSLPAWQWLAEGGDPKPVLFEAHADAARWAA